MLHVEAPGMTEHFMPDVKRNTKRTAGVARSGVNPDVVEDPCIEQTSVGNGIQGDATRQAQSALSGVFLAPLRNLQQPVLERALTARRDVLVWERFDTLFVRTRRSELFHEAL